MTNVNDVVPVMDAVVESVPVTVMVEGPLAGSGVTGVELPPPPPQAVTVRVKATRTAIPASALSLREYRPRNPTNSNPPKATASGAGLVPFFPAGIAPLRRCSGEPPVCGKTNPQSAGSVSRVIWVLAAAVPETTTGPAPLVVMLGKL